MTDFKTQQEVWTWLCADDTRQVSYAGSLIGFQNGTLYLFSSNRIYEGSFVQPMLVEKVKPKIKYLKPLHVILQENPGYICAQDSIRYIGSESIIPDMLSSFGRPYSERNKSFSYCDSWIEEKSNDA